MHDNKSIKNELNFSLTNILIMYVYDTKNKKTNK